MVQDATPTLKPHATPSTESDASRATRDDSPALDPVDLRIGVRVAIATFLAGAALIPVVAVPLGELVAPVGVLAISALSLVCAIALAVHAHAGRLKQDDLYVADFVWIGLTAGLVVATGGRSSPFFLLYPLPVLHAGAFQSRRRLIVVSVTAVLAFLTPLAYDTGRTALFAVTAIIAVPPTLVVAWGFNAALTTLRRQRRELTVAARNAETQARTDALTGLGNFRLLSSTLEAETSRARRRDERFALILIDLDGFKAINDDIGHPAGDAALKAVAAALRAELREEDICCRHGGDEFAVVAVGAGDREAGELGVRLADAVAKLRVRSDAGRALSATAGWATFADPTWTAEDLMREADAMLLERKYGPAPSGPLAAASASAAGDQIAWRRSLARSLANAGDERAVLAAAVAHLAGSLDNVAVAAVRTDGTEPRMVASAGAAATAQDDRSVLGLAAEAASGRIAAVAPTTNAEAGGTAHRLAVPMLVGGDVWGALVLASDHERGFDRSERQLAGEVATEAARGLSQLLMEARLEAAGPEEVRDVAAALQEGASERERLAELARLAGHALGMPGEELNMLSVAAFLRDLGIAVVPSTVLQKPASLTVAERALLAGHPIAGERLLRRSPRLRNASHVIRHAREQWDGSGYPDGLQGEAIPLGARVLHACAAWVSLSSPRPWRPAFDAPAARAELRRISGTQLDPVVVDVLLWLAQS
jgi:diguanylate cyclase (GGDEF)-like protein